MDSFDQLKTIEEGNVPAGDVPSQDTTLEEKPCSLPSSTTFSSQQDTLNSKTKFQVFEKVRTWPGAIKRQYTDITSKPDRRFQTHVQCLENFPEGYPRTACYMDSDDAFMQYRRFGYLHARLLLNKQDELRSLEEDLMCLDRLDDEDEATQKYLRSRQKEYARKPDNGAETKKQLLDKIEQKTLEYGKLLLQANQLVAMNRPADRDQGSVMNYFENEMPLAQNDMKFIMEKEDLVTLRPGRENAWLDACVERMLRLPVARFRLIDRLFRSEETRLKTHNPNVHYFTRSRITGFVTTILTMIILLLFVLPIWLLYHLTISYGPQPAAPYNICILLVATLIFSAILSMFTKARRHEIFAASAGYVPDFLRRNEKKNDLAI